MKSFRLVLFAAGIAVLVWLVAHVGTAEILASITRVTWWQFALICAVHGLAVCADTLGWRYAFARTRVPFGTLLAARTAGEAINLVTALASVGGEAVKAWMVRRQVPYEESVPSVIVSKTAGTACQAIFLVLGLIAAFAMVSWTSTIMVTMLWLLLVEVLAIAAFVAVQLSGLVGRAGRLLRLLGLGRADLSVGRLDEKLRGYYREERMRFLASVGWHCIGSALGVLETLIIMRSIGLAASAPVALLVDSLGAGIRFATFLVPASVGALESGNAAAFGALGLGAGAGLVFSLVRRARQVVWIGLGVCVLVVMGARATRHRPEARSRRRGHPEGPAPAELPASPESLASGGREA